MLTASFSRPMGSRLDLEVLVLNPLSQRPEQTGKSLLLTRREMARETLDVRGMTREDLGDQIPPLFSEPRQDHPTVVRAAIAVDQALVLKTVHDVSHVATRNQKLVCEVAERKRTEMIQGLECSELRRRQAIALHLEASALA